MDPSLVLFLIMIAAFIVLTSYFGSRDRAARKRNFRKRLIDGYGKAPEKHLDDERCYNLSGYFDRHKCEGQIDDITWNDLDMDRIYTRIDYTQSAAGEEYLWYLLHTPQFSPSELTDEKLRYWQEHDEERRSAQTVLAGLGHTDKYSIYDYLEILYGLKARSNVGNYAALGLLIASIVLLLINAQAGVLVLVAVLIYNMISYYREKRDNDQYIVVFRYVLRMIEAGRRLAGTCTGPWKEEGDELIRLDAEFAPFRRGSGILVSSTGSSGNPADLVLDYIRILLHLDLIKFNSMLITLQNHREQIDRLATLTGFVDAAVSVACFRASLPYYALPEFSEEKSTGKGDRGSASCFEADELYHPLLEDPIPNSLSTSGWILLTGSNASGKSTFLKASALCALLSQTVLTAPAKKYRGSYFRIYTSMALRDNLTGGESYFIVEIKSLKRILDAGKEKREDKAPVLCFIDEVLRGTNTVERIAASSEILASLRQSGIRCFAATHDVELTDLLSQAYENYHFEEQIEKGDVIFNYRLQKGKASSRNAIRLLEAIGYDEKIVRSAEKRAETFIGTGVWKKPAAAGDAG